MTALQGKDMDTPLSRVEAVLQAADEYMYVHQIARAAEIEEKETKKVLSTLFSMGQIDQIPSVNRWGPRYAWLAARPVAVEPPAIPEEDLVAGVQEATTGEWGAELLPTLSDDLEGDIAKAFAAAGLEMPAEDPEVMAQYRAILSDLDSQSAAHKTAVESLVGQMEQFYDPKARAKNATRYAVAVPRRPLRIVKSRARAEALALAAVRRGAKGAEVFALTPVGKARRDATFEVRRS